MRILYTSQISPQLWDEFTRTSERGHILQSAPWAELKRRFGWGVARVLVLDDDRPLAGAQILLRPLLPLLKQPVIAYIPKGPVLPPHNNRLARTLLAAIHAEARAYGAAFLKVEPDWPWCPDAEDLLRRWGFRPAESIQPRSTIVLDITSPEDEILARMKQKTRYNIRLAARKGVKVRLGTETDLPAFYELLKLTSRRNGFAIHTCEYYEKAFRVFKALDSAVLLLAEYQGEVLAGLMAFAWGKKAWYMYGASSNRHRNRMPNHLLQWEAIRWARARGCTTYDLWGIPDEVGVNPERYQSGPLPLSEGLWGVYRFKRGFGGRVVRYVGAWDYPYSPFWYWLYRVAMKLR